MDLLLGEQSVPLGLHRLELLEQQLETIQLAGDLRLQVSRQLAAVARPQRRKPRPARGKLGRDFAVEEILAVQNMIRCTGVNVKLESVKFQDPLERTVGFALGTADLLGQMAAADYVDKLPILYSEFAEAARYSPDGKMKAGGFFSSAEDLMQKTPLFWENYVRNKINREFQGLFRFLNDPYPDGPNFYIDRIESNIARLRRELAARGRP